MSNKALVFVMICEACVLPTTDYLKDQDTETKNIWFLRKNPAHGILRRHVTTAFDYKIKCWSITAWSLSFLVERQLSEKETYNVPTTLLVLFSRPNVPSNMRANPKSDILGFIFSSKRILPNFRSRCITLKTESRWRYTIPLAMPLIIVKRVVQLSSALLLESNECTKLMNDV